MFNDAAKMQTENQSKGPSKPVFSFLSFFVHTNPPENDVVHTPGSSGQQSPVSYFKANATTQEGAPAC